MKLKRLCTKILRMITRPLVIFPVLMAGIIFGWHVFMAYSRGLDVPANNLLSNGSFENIDAQKAPHGWTIAAHGGTSQVQVNSVEGYVDKRAMRVSVSDYQKGIVRITSPQVAVESATKYFFKSYYKTDVEFDLLVQYHYRDSSTQLELLRHYPDYDYPWSTMSGGVVADGSVSYVSFMVQVVGNGYIEMDGAYVVKTDVEPTVATCGAGQNLLANPDLTAMSGNAPQYWHPSSHGDNDARNTMLALQQNIYVRSEITRYANGEAKWVPDAVPVTQYARYCLSFLYRSDVPTDLGLDFTMADGSTRYMFLGDVLPSTDWTRYTTFVEAPAGAAAVMPHVNLPSAGYLEVDSYQLVRMPGDATVFSRPLVSVTFDDGWATSITNGKPVLDEFGLKGTFYINPGFVDEENFVTFRELLELQKQGHHLGSHGNMHIDLTAFTPSKVSSDLEDSKNYLLRKLDEQTVDFASPYGKHDAKSDVMIKNLYASHRGTDLGVNTKQNFELYNLKVLFVRRDTPLGELRQYIDMAKATNGWLILVYHQIEDTNDPFIVTQQTLRGHMQEVQKSGLAVVTVRDALRELRSQR